MADTSLSVYGLPVHVEPKRPRYVLPPDVPPPTGMTRAEFASWSRMVCGFQKPLVKDGEVMCMGWAFLVNERTFYELKAATATKDPRND